jgi:hypothetical protein
MDNKEETTQKIIPSRRRFVLGVGVLSVFSAIAALIHFPFHGKKNIISCGPEEKKKMVRMLTQDGKLVEIDESLLPAKGKKISNSELQNWIKT